MRSSASGLAAAVALVAILGAFGGVPNEPPASEGAAGPLAAGLLDPDRACEAQTRRRRSCWPPNSMPILRSWLWRSCASAGSRR